MPEKLSGAVVAGLKQTVQRHEHKEREAAEPAAAPDAAPQPYASTAARAPHPCLHARVDTEGSSGSGRARCQQFTSLE